MDATVAEPLVPVQLPADGQPTEQFCMDLEQAMLKATWAGVHGTAAVMPPELLQRIVQSVVAITGQEPTLMEVQPSAQQQRVTVVGDTHGQYHDVCKLFELYGRPSADRIYIFNGDFVDRGAWGVEVLALLMAYKWLLPHNVYLVRGNHESNIITQMYGFAAELKAKYGKAAKGLFTHLKRFFASLPLAALVEHSTLILHGGLFRAPPAKAKAGAKRRRSAGVKLTVGTLDDLRKASKGGQDPDPDRSLKNLVACDVLWSDPVNDPGIRANEARGCGTVFGPDVTAEFLAANGLRLIIRSHEGPDARDRRLEGDKMPSVDSGYAEDHVTDSGKLVTLFSAPDYPQFIADGEDRYHNKAAVLHLTAPDYATPRVESFEAVLPRPQVESYYEVPSYTEDEEDEGEQATEAGTEAGSTQQGDKQAAAATEDTASTATAATAAEDAPAVADAAARATSPAAVPGPAQPAAAEEEGGLPAAAAGAQEAAEGSAAPEATPAAAEHAVVSAEVVAAGLAAERPVIAAAEQGARPAAERGAVAAAAAGGVGPSLAGAAQQAGEGAHLQSPARAAAGKSGLALSPSHAHRHRAAHAAAGHGHPTSYEAAVAAEAAAVTGKLHQHVAVQLQQQLQQQQQQQPQAPQQADGVDAEEDSPDRAAKRQKTRVLAPIPH